MTEERLAQRYRTLLTFYPRWYRAERGDEIVGTLLDCAGAGQARPTWRETRALILGGLRVRAGNAGRRSVRAVMLDGLRLTVLLLIATWTLGAATELLGYDFGPAGRPRLVAAVALVAGLVPFLLVARGWYGAALPVLLLGAAAWVPWFAFGGPADHFLRRVLVASAAALVGAVLLWWKQPMTSRAGVGVVVFAVFPPLLHDLPTWLMEFGFDNDPDVLWYPQALLFVLLYVGVLGYATVDPRLAMAFAAFVFVDATTALVGAAANGLDYVNPIAVVTLNVIIPAGALAAAWVGARSQAHRPVGVGG